jgi:hypothetical protein
MSRRQLLNSSGALLASGILLPTGEATVRLASNATRVLTGALHGLDHMGPGCDLHIHPALSTCVARAHIGVKGTCNIQPYVVARPQIRSSS